MVVYNNNYYTAVYIDKDTGCMRRSRTILFVGILLSMMATACVHEDAGQDQPTGFGKQWVKHVLVQQCHKELNKRQEWQAASFILTDDQKEQLSNKMCDCAATEASMQLGTLDMLKLVSEEQRKQVLLDVSTKAMASCSRKFLFRH